MKVQFVEWKPNYYSLLNTSICLSLIIIPYITLNALELRVLLSKIYLHFSLINIIIITLPKICSNNIIKLSNNIKPSWKYSKTKSFIQHSPQIIFDNFAQRSPPPSQTSPYPFVEFSLPGFVRLSFARSFAFRRRVCTFPSDQIKMLCIQRMPICPPYPPMLSATEPSVSPRNPRSGRAHDSPPPSLPLPRGRVWRSWRGWADGGVGRGGKKAE